MKNQKTMGNKGFSLVELIVVIAIMAVLVGVLAPQFIKYVENSRVSTDMQNVQELKTAIEVWAADNESASNVKITVTATAKTAVSDQNPGTVGATVKLKSSKWHDCTFEFNPSTGTWTPSGTTTNDNGKDLKDIF